ncbi:hypothetical protein FSARC_4844 [Fusarium sarcochroum]|uniref:Uncharacterized protein n=1 Tax=Fusarium sarcochroum TaxID=1208366 RepID=A0A8H4U0U5_9HYPO|nr:hypothetical protein FSARC_4844 [Fusarium sarcochroum]
MATTRARRKKAGNLKSGKRPKAKTKKPRPPGRMWEDHEWHQLLAYIQWSAEAENDFWDEAFPLFNKAVGSEFTRTQIRKKLARECPKYLHEINMTWKDILTQGLRDLSLPVYAKEEVERLLDELRHSEPSSYNGSTEIAKKEREKGHDGHQATKKGTRNSRVGSAAYKNNPGAINVPEHSEDELSSFIPPNDAVRSAGDMPIQRAETPRIQMCDGRPDSQNKEITTLKNRNFLLANENIRLKEELRTFQQCKPDVEVMRGFEKMFEDIQSKSQSNRSFDMDKRGLQKENITGSYEALYSNIRDACLDLVQVDGELPERNRAFYRSAQSWAQRIFNKDLVTCIQDIHEEKLSKDELLTGLIARAVIELVFVPAFPDVLTTEDPTTDHYRGIILLFNGPDELHKADLSVLSSLMQNRKSEILENKERDLTELITRNLECFWTSQSTEQTAQQSPDGDVMMLDGLVCGSFLTSALDLKLELTGSLTRLKHFPVKPYLLKSKPAFFLFCFSRNAETKGWLQVEATVEEMQSLELAAKAIVLT